MVVIGRWSLYFGTTVGEIGRRGFLMQDAKFQIAMQPTTKVYWVSNDNIILFNCN